MRSDRLRDLRYVEGPNIILEFRFAGGDFAQGRRLAAKLVDAPVDVIVTEDLTPDAGAVTERVPIVAVCPRFGQRRSAGDAAQP
jgi:hypothetical protein